MNGTAASHVSILIPTRGRPESLVRSVASVVAYLDGESELIIVDQSADSARALIANIDNGDAVKYVHAPGEGKSKALNIALAAARHDLVATIDDDITVGPEWLAQGVRLMSEWPEISLTFGAVQAAPHDASVGYIPDFLPPRRIILRSPQLSPQLGAMGANMFLRKSAVAAAGGWDESRGPGSISRSGDDWDLAYRLLRAGGLVMIAPELSVVHWGQRSYADGSARRLITNYYRGMGFGLASYVREGDARAIALLARVLLDTAASTSRNVVTFNRPIGVRRLTALIAGSVAGFRAHTPRPVGRFPS